MIASAMAMYGGESISFETNFTNPVYTVTGNFSNLDGLNVTFENGNITISPAINYFPDNFTLIFFDNITNEVIKEIHHGGGGSHTKYIDKNVTKFIPEYINNTEIVEKIIKIPIDNTTVIETGFKLWHVLLSMVVGGGFVLYIIYKKKKEDSQKR